MYTSYGHAESGGIRKTGHDVAVLVDVQLDEMSDSGLLEEAMYRLPDEVPDVQMWMDIGDAEGLFLPSQVRRVAHELLERGIGTWDSLAFLEQPEACHQESDWGARVDLPLLYMFGEVGQPVALEMQGRDHWFIRWNEHVH